MERQTRAKDKLNVQVSYDSIASRYVEEITPIDCKPFDCAQVDRFLDVLPNGPIWDLGCGPGDVTRYIRDRQREVVGVDLSRAMIEQARGADPSGSYLVKDMTALPVPLESLAGLTSFYSLIHVAPSQVPATLQSWFEALLPGGGLLLAVHVGEAMLHLDTMLDQSVDLDFYFFKPESLAAALVAAGFQVESLDVRDPYPDIEAQTRRIYVLARKPVLDPVRSPYSEQLTPEHLRHGACNAA